MPVGSTTTPVRRIDRPCCWAAAGRDPRASAVTSTTSPSTADMTTGHVARPREDTGPSSLRRRYTLGPGHGRGKDFSSTGEARPGGLARLGRAHARDLLLRRRPLA